MSIGIVAEAEGSAWVWGIWLAVAAVPAAVVWRRTPTAGGASDEPRVVPLLVGFGVIAFVVWIATQVLYLAVRQPAMATGTTQPAFPPGDLAMLSLLSAMTGWAVGLGLLNASPAKDALGYAKRSVVRGIGVGAVGALVSIPLIALVLQATLWLWARIDYAHPKQHDLLDAMRHAPATWVRVASVLSAVVAAPLFEELLFRGCLQNAVRRASGSAVVAILAASLPFTLIHATWTMPPIFVFAVLLGVVYERTRSLWATTVMHALFNGFSVAMNLIG